MEDLFKEKFYSMQLLNEPKLAQKLAWWFSGMFVILILISLLPWTQNFKTTGKLTALNQEQRPQSIQATIPGRIEKWLKHEGEVIKKGDTIVILSEIKDKYFDPNTLQRMEEQLDAKKGSLSANKEKVIALSNQISALKAARVLSLEKAKNKVSQFRLKIKSDSMDLIASQLDYETAKGQFERQQKLYDQGLKSLTELEQRRLKFQESQAKLTGYQNKFEITKRDYTNALIELNSIEAEYMDKISKAESEKNSAESYVFSLEGDIAKTGNDVSNVRIRNSFYCITASQSGYLVKAAKNGIGETLKEGENVCSIIPNNVGLAAELYVKPMDLPLIQVGTKMRLQFDGWPAMVFSGWPNTSFGTFGGEIAVIDKIDTKGKYRILVIPDHNHLQDEPWPTVLPIGSGVYGWAMLNDVPIWFEIWRELNGFPPDYVDHNEEDSKEKTKKDKEKEDEK